MLTRHFIIALSLFLALFAGSYPDLFFDAARGEPQPEGVGGDDDTELIPLDVPAEDYADWRFLKKETETRDRYDLAGNRLLAEASEARRQIEQAISRCSSLDYMSSMDRLRARREEVFLLVNLLIEGMRRAGGIDRGLYLSVFGARKSREDVVHDWHEAYRAARRVEEDIAALLEGAPDYPDSCAEREFPTDEQPGEQVTPYTPQGEARPAHEPDPRIDALNAEADDAIAHIQAAVEACDAQAYEEAQAQLRIIGERLNGLVADIANEWGRVAGSVSAGAVDQIPLMNKLAADRGLAEAARDAFIELVSGLPALDEACADQAALVPDPRIEALEQAMIVKAAEMTALAQACDWTGSERAAQEWTALFTQFTALIQEIYAGVVEAQAALEESADEDTAQALSDAMTSKTRLDEAIARIQALSPPASPPPDCAAPR